MASKHLDAGVLDERLAVLALREDAPGAYGWEAVRMTWGAVEQSTKRNVWSVHGIGATGVTITMRRQPLTLGHAIRWGRQHCFITSILPVDRNYMEVGAALVLVSPCEDKYTGTKFPGIVTEKYLGHDQLEPQATNTLRHVLVTPKCIDLTPGRLVAIGDEDWPIQVAHTLDPWHNEYELERVVDL